LKDLPHDKTISIIREKTAAHLLLLFLSVIWRIFSALNQTMNKSIFNLWLSFIVALIFSIFDNLVVFIFQNLSAIKLLFHELH